MACNVGTFFFTKGYSVIWLSDNKESLLRVENKINKEVRRLQRFFPDRPKDQYTDFLTYYQTKNLSSFNIILESTSEILEKKQKSVALVKHLIKNNDTLLLSTSSSLFPGEIDPVCIGLHFFYPVELTETVEIIVPDNGPDSIKLKAKTLSEELGLSTIEQSEGNAFAVNRLLLPLQAEAFRLLMEGYSPQSIENSTKSNLLPFGQLSIMDSVGLDVILAGIKNYIRRMPDNIQGDYNPLLHGLEEVVSNGKLGNKSNNGLLVGEPLPWSSKNHLDADIKSHFSALFINTCNTFLNTGQISHSSLDLALTSVFQADVTFLESVKEKPQDSFRTLINNLYKQTHLSYFEYLQ